MLRGVETRETRTLPYLANDIESWKNGMIWPKADHGSIITWRLLAIFSSSSSSVFLVRVLVSSAL